MNILVVGDKIECRDIERHVTVYVNVTWSKYLKYFPDNLAANVISHYPDIRRELHWTYIVIDVELPAKARRKGAVVFMPEIKERIKEWIG